MIQLYTGNGKGKTTAAIGLAVRAAGAGKKVYIAQFCKGRRYAELTSLKALKNIRLEQFGSTCFIRGGRPAPRDFALARKGLASIQRAIAEKKYRMIVLDEIHIALYYRLVDLGRVLEIVRAAPRSLELVLTGRHAPEELIECADLVSEITDVKHYFRRGVKARRGIEH